MLKKLWPIALILPIFALAAFFITRLQPIRPSTSGQTTAGVSPSVTPDMTYVGWIEYFDTNFGLDLYYPPQFKTLSGGRLTAKVRPGAKGTEICINLDGCLTGKISQFEIRSTSVGWLNQPKSAPSFTDLQGYRQEGGIYYVRLPSGEEQPLPSELTLEIFSNYGVPILVVRGQSGDQADRAHPVLGWVGAVINRRLPVFPALVIKMQPTSQISAGTFLQILHTVSFPPENNFPSDAEINREAPPPNYYNASIKSALADIAKIVTCRFVKDGRYPDSYYPDTVCGSASTLINAVTQRPYYYQAGFEGQKFTLRAKLSTGEVYTVTEITNPPPTPTPGKKPTPPPTPKITNTPEPTGIEF